MLVVKHKGPYFLNTIPRREDGVKIYRIHVEKCGHLDEDTDLRHLRTRNAEKASDRALNYIDSLHYDDDRGVSFCQHCCAEEHKKYG